MVIFFRVLRGFKCRLALRLYLPWRGLDLVDAGTFSGAGKGMMGRVSEQGFLGCGAFYNELLKLYKSIRVFGGIE